MDQLEIEIWAKYLSQLVELGKEYILRVGLDDVKESPETSVNTLFDELRGRTKEDPFNEEIRDNISLICVLLQKLSWSKSSSSNIWS